MNYISEVAKMLGVELEEEFKINDDSTNKFKLTNSGLFFLNHVGVWGSCDHKLTQLLNGKHEIIKLPKSILTEEEKEYLSNLILDNDGNIVLSAVESIAYDLGIPLVKITGGWSCTKKF